MGPSVGTAILARIEVEPEERRIGLVRRTRDFLADDRNLVVDSRAPSCPYTDVDYTRSLHSSASCCLSFFMLRLSPPFLDLVSFFMSSFFRLFALFILGRMFMLVGLWQSPDCCKSLVDMPGKNMAIKNAKIIFLEVLLCIAELRRHALSRHE